ncbi:PREDICTED: protein transport protein SEC31 homolog A isoform X2 [Brassica oleracea var. oleracea]|uniref:protein transport protein SEC31 homolog A isoform X2 n=1 Tax=Brassica oleracea var. oleracea TaxID=109376 RepID=UPI0006A72120|nr:PREDICTED: protein transport protein SEC31 homolog A isoform X2 [Brassica oleracea var. oleracea]
MSCIKRVDRSAYVAMAPEAPFIAAGTMAGAVDLSFSSSSNLEIFELDFNSEDHEMKLLGQCSSSERFTRLAWGSYGSGSEESPYGCIAGGLVDGNIGLWNPLTLIRAHVRYLSKHKGPVRALEFNVISPNQLASGDDDDGTVCIWDLADTSEPSHVLKGTGSYTQGEISSVSWNREFKHVLASTSYNGTTVIWDVNNKKVITGFKNSESSDRFKGLISCSVLQWDPDNCNQIMIASDEDSSPSVKLLDIRYPQSPVRTFSGHHRGVIAMEWCPSDSLYLLTCARDNRTICWNTKTGQIVAELPTTNNSNFDVHWSPKIPGVVSASSADGNISIYNLEGCSRNGSGENNLIDAAPLTAPKWWKRPVSASFGFGGKLVSSNSKLPEASVVFLHSLATEQSLVNRITKFETEIENGEKTSLMSLCKKKSEETESEEEKETWSLLKIMLEEDGNAKTKLRTHLGFSLPCEDQKDQEHHATYSSENVEEEISDPLFDDAIERSLIVGDYKEAVAHCLSANKMADALVIAHVGGSTLWESTLDKYLKMSNAPYMKVVSAMVNNDLMSLVHTRPAKLWKETLALICTFAEGDEWTSLCDALASHLLSSGFTLAATLCYICAGNVDKTVDIWLRGLEKDNAGKSYSERVQDLMEKTVVLALATENKRFSGSLYKLFESYAEILASQGLLATAIKFLKLLEPGDFSSELSILRERFSQSVYQEPTQTQPNLLISPYNQAQPALQPSFTPAPVTNAQPSKTTLVSLNPPPHQQRSMDFHSSTRYTNATYNPPPALYLNSKIHQTVVQQVELMVPAQRVAVQPPPAPVAPPPTVQTADTSNVPAHQKPIVATLTRLFKETSDTLGPAKKRDIEGISKKVGSLFAKLNNEDISKHAAEKLSLLCQALDKQDFNAALQIQTHMASTEWDECNFWLLPLKQMIKGRQNVR